MDKVFESYLFENDDLKYSNWKVQIDRPYLIAILLFLISIIFFLFSLPWLGLLLMFGYFIAKLTGFIKGSIGKKQVGRITKKILIDFEKICIESDEIHFAEIDFIKLTLNSFDGKMEGSRYRVWKSDGCNNQIEIQTSKGNSKMNFWLPTYHHVNHLKAIDFPENVHLIDNIIP